MKSEASVFFYGILIVFMIIFLGMILVFDLKEEETTNKLFPLYLMNFVGVLGIVTIFLIIEKMSVTNVSLLSYYYIIPFTMILISIIGIVISTIIMSNDDIQSSEIKKKKFKYTLYTLIGIIMLLYFVSLTIKIITMYRKI